MEADERRRHFQISRGLIAITDRGEEHWLLPRLHPYSFSRFFLRSSSSSSSQLRAQEKGRSGWLDRQERTEDGPYSDPILPVLSFLFLLLLCRRHSVAASTDSGAVLTLGLAICSCFYCQQLRATARPPRLLCGENEGFLMWSMRFKTLRSPAVEGGRRESERWWAVEQQNERGEKEEEEKEPKKTIWASHRTGSLNRSSSLCASSVHLVNDILKVSSDLPLFPFLVSRLSRKRKVLCY